MARDAGDRAVKLSISKARLGAAYYGTRPRGRLWGPAEGRSLPSCERHLNGSGEIAQYIADIFEQHD